MLYKRYLQMLNNAIAENGLLKFTVVVLAIGFVWCAYKINDIKDKVRTVVVPPVLNSKVEISGSWTTDSYIKEFGKYIAAMLWNYSPGTAREQFGEILCSWHPSTFDDAKNRLYILADQIEKTKAASVFYSGPIKHNRDLGQFEISGNRRLTQQDQQVENSNKTYVVSYKVDNGRFWITGVADKSVVASKPIGGPALGQTTNPAADGQGGGL